MDAVALHLALQAVKFNIPITWPALEAGFLLACTRGGVMLSISTV